MRSKLTYANVVSTICLFLLLGGIAFAAVKLPKNSVGAKQIKDGSIGLKEIQNSAEDSLAGTDGVPGSTGSQGAPGEDGTSIVARARSVGTTAVPSSGTIDIPLTGNTWTQGSTEVAQLPISGRVSFTPPSVDGCGDPGTGYLGVAILVNGVPISEFTITTFVDGVPAAQGLGLTNTMPEPGSPVQRTVTVRVHDLCSDPAATFQITDLRLNVVGMR